MPAAVGMPDRVEKEGMMVGEEMRPYIFPHSTARALEEADPLQSIFFWQGSLALGLGLGCKHTL